MARLSYIVAIIAIATCVLAEEFYSDQYDNVDVEKLMSNSKLREQYYNCFIGTSPCRTADAKYFKKIIVEAILTGCRKCTEKQKQNLDYIIDWYARNNPVALQNLIAKNIEDLQKKNSK